MRDSTFGRAQRRELVAKVGMAYLHRAFRGREVTQLVGDRVLQNIGGNASIRPPAPRIYAI